VSGEICHDLVLSGGKEMFRLALKIGWPISLALLLVYLSMGLLVRVAPQMNMLMVGFPITISVGLVVIMLGVPSFTLTMEGMFQDAVGSLERLLIALRV
jgi:flagellar biosynthetic protein FliR